MIFLKHTFLGKLVFFILLFLFIYPFKVNGFPVSFRVLFAAFGGVILLLRFLALPNTFFSDRILRLYLAIIPICLISAITIFIFNGTRDMEYVNFWILPTLCLLSSYFVIAVGRYVMPGLNFIQLSEYFIGVVLAQAIISAVMFLIPSVYTALLNIQQMDDLDAYKSQLSVGTRLMGIGASFAIMGVINCVALLLIIVILKQGKTTASFRLYLIIAYLIIFVIGMMQSRTTLIGFFVSLSYLFFSSFQINLLSVKKIFKITGSIIAVCLFLLGTIVFFAGDFIRKNQQIIDYGFELVVNYQKTGTLQSNSTNDLRNMYVFPQSLKTYFIGDGKFYIVPGEAKYGYYMHTDVGFLRLIYYFGITGMLFFFLYQYMLIKYSFTVELPDYKMLIFYFFLLVVLWNLKGVLDTNILYTPFCVLNMLRARPALMPASVSARLA